MLVRLCRHLFLLSFCLLFHPSCGWSPVFATNCYHDSRYASLPEKSVQQTPKLHLYDHTSVTVLLTNLASIADPQTPLS